MAKVILITGGAASGKTRWATSYLEKCDRVLYLRTNPKLDIDTEHRIEFANNKNGTTWDIVTDVYEDPVQHFDYHKFIIFDALSTYTSHMIEKMCANVDEFTEDMRHEIEKKVIDDVNDMIEEVRRMEGTMVIITLETGFSVMPSERSQAIFRKVLGKVNQRVAHLSNEVYFSASGIQFKIK